MAIFSFFLESLPTWVTKEKGCLDEDQYWMFLKRSLLPWREDVTHGHLLFVLWESVYLGHQGGCLAQDQNWDFVKESLLPWRDDVTDDRLLLFVWESDHQGHQGVRLLGTVFELGVCQGTSSNLERTWQFWPSSPCLWLAKCTTLNWRTQLISLYGIFKRNTYVLKWFARHK